MIVSTEYGQMIINRHDINQANPLFKTGLAIDHAEIVLLMHLLSECSPGPVAIDVGANFGTYTLAFAQTVGEQGSVHSFEPQRLIFQMLAGSVSLNAFTNVFCYNAAVGDREGNILVPQYDYTQPLNFGSIEFGREQWERLSQQPLDDPERREYVSLTTLDRFGWQRADIIKIDVEGMELDVLLGAHETIVRCRPILFVEFVKSDHSALVEFFRSLGYSLFETGCNFLALPPEKSKLASAYPQLLHPV